MRIPDHIPGPRMWRPPTENREAPAARNAIAPSVFPWETPALAETRQAIEAALSEHNQKRDDFDGEMILLQSAVGFRAMRRRLEARHQLTASVAEYYELLQMYLREAKGLATSWNRDHEDSLRVAERLLKAFQNEAETLRQDVASLKEAGF